MPMIIVMPMIAVMLSSIPVRYSPMNTADIAISGMIMMETAIWKRS